MVHNGVIAGFHEMRRELMLEVAPELFANIEGSTDSEVLFHLALTYGLERDPVAALERTIGLVEATAARHGIENPVQTSIGVTDGERLWALRYSTERRSRSLFVSNDASAIRELHPENPRLQRLRDEDRVVVSEPLSDLPGLWQEIPESTVLVVQPGPDEQHAIQPALRARAARAVVTETEISTAEPAGPRTVEVVVSVPTVVKAVGIFFALLLAYLVRDALLSIALVGGDDPRARSAGERVGAAWLGSREGGAGGVRVHRAGVIGDRDLGGEAGLARDHRLRRRPPRPTSTRRSTAACSRTSTRRRTRSRSSRAWPPRRRRTCPPRRSTCSAPPPASSAASSRW